MSNVKLSQIASGSAFVPATDNIVTVRSGNTDVLTTLGTVVTENLGTVIVDDGAGNLTIGSGVVTSTMLGSNSVTTAKINAAAVTYAKMQQASTVTLLGNPTGGTANVQEITLGSGLAFSGSTLTASGSGGTVTSVDLSMPAEFSVSGSPVTGSGTITVTKANESANTVYAGPGSGGAAAPTFRAIVAADVPTLNQNTTGTASNVTGAVAIANGGTGHTTAYAAKDALTIQGANIASASTTNLAAATGELVIVTGNATINALGTAAAGVERVVLFTGTPTLTYNSTSLILPGSQSITVQANDMAIFRSLGSGNWLCVDYVRATFSFYNTAGNYQSPAIGYGNTSSGYGTAIGYGNTAAQGVAIGAYCQSSEESGIAVGYNCTTTNSNYAVAIGYKCSAAGKYSSASGYRCTVSADYSTASGYAVNNIQSRSSAFGYESIYIQCGGVSGFLPVGGTWYSQNGTPGLAANSSQVVTLAKLTSLGSNGSITIRDGLVTAYTAPT